MIVPIIDGEAILRRENREISILVASEEVTITHAWCSAGEQVAGPHVHHEHTDAFYVLEGELTFEIGREAKTITVSAGGFVAAPPEVAHSLRNNSDRTARWLTIHAPDGGFAAFMRGIRDGVEVEWDISAVPPAAACPQATRSSDHEKPSRGQWSICSTQTTVGWASVLSPHVRSALLIHAKAGKGQDDASHGELTSSL